MADSLFGVVYDRARFIDFLERRLGKQPDVFEERPGGQYSVFTLSVDENGRPLAHGSMSWAIGRIGRKDGSLMFSRKTLASLQLRRIS